MRLSPEGIRLVAEHQLKRGDTAAAITAFRIASDAGDALSTVFLATFVRDDRLASPTAVAKDAPDALACWYAAIDREYTETPPTAIRPRELKRLLTAYAAMTTTTAAKESA